MPARSPPGLRQAQRGALPGAATRRSALVTSQTGLAGAALLLEDVAIRARCGDCRAEFEIDTLTFTCPMCGSGFVDLLSGRELQVVSLETAEEMACER